MRTRIVPFLAAVALVASLPMAASAADVHAWHSRDARVLTNGKVGGSKVKVGATLKAKLKGKATLLLPGTTLGVKCSSASVTDKIKKNPSAPGIAVESLTSQTFSKCTSNIPGTTGVKKISVLHLPYRTTISSATGKPVIIFNASTQLTLNTVIGTITCVFRAATLHGTAVNAGNEIRFGGQRFKLSSGSAACPKAGNFSATFGPVTNTSVSSHPKVYVN